MIDSLGNSEQFDIALRLFSAAGGGAVIGLNRFLKHKSAGMRTHVLTALSAALATIVALQFDSVDAASRVMQGLLTGVGFIGAGVIMRDGESHVQGLTTAASIWLCAVIGIACGADKLMIAAAVVIIALAVLIVGRPLERFIARMAHDEKAANDEND
jgi:putative Mg2+ transporter-C (MgtC) family protein